MNSLKINYNPVCLFLSKGWQQGYVENRNMKYCKLFYIYIIHIPLHIIGRFKMKEYDLTVTQFAFAFSCSGLKCSQLEQGYRLDKYYQNLLSCLPSRDTSYAMLSSGVAWNIPRVTCIFWYTHDPSGECVYQQNTK